MLLAPHACLHMLGGPLIKATAILSTPSHWNSPPLKCSLSCWSPFAAGHSHRGLTGSLCSEVSEVRTQWWVTGGTQNTACYEFRAYSKLPAIVIPCKPFWQRLYSELCPQPCNTIYLVSFSETRSHLGQVGLWITYPPASVSSAPGL